MIYNTKVLLSAVVILLSSIACSIQKGGPVATTPVTTPVTTPTTVPATASPAPTIAATEADDQTAVVRAAVVNVRAKPGGEVVGQVEAGQEVTVLETDGDWVRIEGGWIWGGCLVGSTRGCEAK
jgi:uncharacterized protein YgiM (DUF1202 family)